MKNILTKYLYNFYEEVNPKEFYRFIFKEGELQNKGIYEEGKYNGIIIEVSNEKRKNNKSKILRHTLTDDLDKINEVIKRDNFCLMSPISYVGKTRESRNARILYALTIDLDGVIVKENVNPIGLKTLFHQIHNIDRIPNPTFIVSSGTGLHLYYVFDRPIMLFPNVIKEFQKYKRRLTQIIWQGYITELESNVQYESLFQGFRVVGTITKKGERARAFLTGERVDIEYLNKFVEKEEKIKDIAYKSKITLEKAKEKYPEWYQKRIVKKQTKGTWITKRALYDWWKERIIREAKTGHRYYCLMTLSIYARKAGIEREELEKDAFELMKKFDKLPSSSENRFTEKDVLDALQAFDDRYLTYPINSISYVTDIRIEKNKRNGRKQEEHLKGARALRDIYNSNWREKNGRKSKEEIIKKWRDENPTGKKIDCIKETGLSKMTVYKWW